MGREEQVEEREVLESIFPDEITSMSIIFPMRMLIAFHYFSDTLCMAVLEKWKW